MRNVYKSPSTQMMISILKELPIYMRETIQMRYWRQRSIEDIAKRFRVNWKEADHIIQLSLARFNQLYFKKLTFEIQKQKRKQVLSELKNLNFKI